MNKTFSLQSGTLSDMREVSIEICGKMYSEAFLSSLDNDDSYKARERASSSKNNVIYARYIQEYIEVKQMNDGNICWKAVDEVPHYKYDFDYNSSFGLFHSDNRGEFGGTLITPKSQMIRGNFFKLFELNGKVYAIDTLSHMAVSHTKIYEFNSNSEYKILYETNSDDMLSLTGLTIAENKAYLLISGAVLGENHTFTGSKVQSILFEINNTGLTQLAVFDHEFHYVYNMLIKDDNMILGMDKLVAVVNIKDKEIQAYSPLTTYAENDILKTAENKHF